MRLVDEHYLEHPTEGVKRMRDFCLPVVYLPIIKEHAGYEVNGSNDHLSQKEPEQTWTGSVYQAILVERAYDRSS